MKQMRVFWDKWRNWMFGGLMEVILLGLGGAMYTAYDSYKNMIVEQQQQHLLLRTHAVAKNLELYFSEQLREISMLIQTPGFLVAMDRYYELGEEKRAKEYVYAYMLANQQGPSRVYFLDTDGEPVFHYSQYPLLEDFDEASLDFAAWGREGVRGIGGVFPISESHFGLALVNDIYGGNGYQGSILAIYDMDEINRRFLRPLSAETGYITVKDAAGTILMHPVRELSGFNPAGDIEEFESLPQYEDMRETLKKQYENEEGTAVCKVYSGGLTSPEEEIVAFSRMNLWGTSWYISASIPYSRALNMEIMNLRRFGFLTAGVFCVAATGGIAIVVLLKNRQKLKLEAGYLKEINHTLEELHRSQEEARHYQKLTTIGALAGGIVHEFNNLLTPIIGYSEFLQGQLGEDSEYYEDIDEIRRAGLRAKEIVERILPFSRRETDTTEFQVLKLDVLISESLKTLSLVLLSNIRLEQRFADGDAAVLGNATQIHQVLMNLYSNAVQSMAERGGVLTVETRRLRAAEMPEQYPETYGVAPETDFVEIRVCDTGCGMSGEVLSQIFNPFFTTKESGEGTGLGLSVVKDIMISHGGFIQAESEIGRGSCFFACLPVYDGKTEFVRRPPETEKREL